jgi:hypothetical protein
LVSGDPGGVERVFRTSGTTRGFGRRGEHHVLDLTLYRESLLPNFRAHLLPEGWERVQVFCFLPAPEHAPESSLSYMMGEVVEALGGDGSDFLLTPAGEIDVESCRRGLEAASDDGKPVLLAGTAFSFVRWIDIARETRWEIALPPGSRIMETGGYKGRSRALPRKELYSALSEVFGVPQGRIVNEYGMTELLSQFYEPILVFPLGGAGNRSGNGTSDQLPVGVTERVHRGPPWTRTRVLDPLTLEPLPMGEVGVLAHLDLANLGSVAAVLTEDLGRMAPGGFQVLGRMAGSEPRGCSLAMGDFLAAGGGGRG